MKVNEDACFMNEIRVAFLGRTQTVRESSTPKLYSAGGYLLHVYLHRRIINITRSSIEALLLFIRLPPSLSTFNDHLRGTLPHLQSKLGLKILSAH